MTPLRLSAAGRALTGGAVLAGLVLLGGVVPAGAQALAWSVVPSPSPGSGDVLTDVSCVSAAICTAVGTEATSGGPATLIESWDGTRWSVVHSPSPDVNQLHGVSCVSPTACTAVGYIVSSDSALVESWDGTRWSVTPGAAESFPTVLNAVSCTSAAACVAVGEIYNRTSPSAQPRTLIESWDGTTWSVIPSPNRGNTDGLSGISCLSATACTAVGTYLHRLRQNQHASTLIESWDGTSWSVVPSPNEGAGGNYLVGVACMSAVACTAIGQHETSSGSRTLIESWDGTRWSVTRSPNPGRGSYNENELDGVACASPTACTAVGDDSVFSSGYHFRTLIESWDGTSWSVTPSPRLRTKGNYLHGLACASPAACTAVGSGGAGTLIESGTAGR